MNYCAYLCVKIFPDLAFLAFTSESGRKTETTEEM